jgi:hypothetical protein
MDAMMLVSCGIWRRTEQARWGASGEFVSLEHDAINRVATMWGHNDVPTQRAFSDRNGVLALILLYMKKPMRANMMRSAL